MGSIFDIFKGGTKKQEQGLTSKINKLRLSLNKDQDGKCLFDLKYTVLKIQRLKTDGFSADNGFWQKVEQDRRFVLSRLEQDDRTLAVCRQPRTISAGNRELFCLYVLAERKGADELRADLQETCLDENYNISSLDVFGYNHNPERDKEKETIILKLAANRIFRNNVSLENHKTVSVAGENILLFKTKNNQNELIGLDFIIEPEKEISARVATFCRRSYYLNLFKKSSQSKKEQIYHLPLYRKVDGILVFQFPKDGLAPEDPDDDQLYIRRSPHPDSRNLLPEFKREKGSVDPDDEMEWYSKVSACKATYLEFFVNDINAEFKDVFTVSFEEVVLENIISHYGINKRKGLAREAFIQSFGGSREIHLVSLLPEEDKGNLFIPSIKASFETFLKGANITVSTGRDILPDQLNLVLLHDERETGDKATDKYWSEYNDSAIVQHITVETLLEAQPSPDSYKFPDYLAYVLIHELLIKRDILQRHFSFPYNKDLFTSKNLTFVWKEKYIKNKKKTTVFFIMDINVEDGRIRFDFFPSEQPKEDSSVNFDYFRFFLPDLEQTSDAFIFCSENGSALVSTAPFTIHPDYEKMREHIMEDRGLRNAVAKNDCFAGYYGAFSFKHNGDNYYCAGLMPDGLTSDNIKRSIRPRKIEKKAGADDDAIVKSIFSLLDNVYLYKDRMSVYPVPIKYLREYSKLWVRHEGKEYKALEDDSEDSDDSHQDDWNGTLFDEMPAIKSKPTGKRTKTLGFEIRPQLYNRLIAWSKSSEFYCISEFERAFHSEYLPDFLTRLGLPFNEKDAENVELLKNSHIINVMRQLKSKKGI